MPNLGQAVFTIKTDTAPFAQPLRQAESVAQQASQNIARSLKTVDSQSKETTSTWNVMRQAMERGIGFGAGLGIFNAFTSTLGIAKNAIIGMNAQLETSQLQFATLLGSAEKAKQKVADLFEFAKVTPFETGPIIQASRTLQVFGGDVLNSNDNLKLIGDTAAAVSAPINELAFWIGRLYSAIKGGQPFGEAAMRLQELAVLTPEARQRMEELQKTGADSTQVWGVFTQSIQKYTGAMEKQAQTWAGVTSTFSDNVKLLSAEAFEPLFEVIRDGINQINVLLGRPEVERGVAGFAEGLAETLRGVGQSFSQMSVIIVPLGKGLLSIAEAGQRIVAPLKALGITIESITHEIPLLIAAFIAWRGVMATIALVEFITNLIRMNQAIVTMSGGASNLATVFRFSLLQAIQTPTVAVGALTVAIIGLDIALRKTTGGSLLDWLTGAKARTDALAESTKRLSFYADDYVERLRTARPGLTTEELNSQAYADLTKKLQELYGALSLMEKPTSGWADALGVANHAVGVLGETFTLNIVGAGAQVVATFNAMKNAFSASDWEVLGEELKNIGKQLVEVGKASNFTYQDWRKLDESFPDLKDRVPEFRLQLELAKDQWNKAFADMANEQREFQREMRASSQSVTILDKFAATAKEVSEAYDQMAQSVSDATKALSRPTGIESQRQFEIALTEAAIAQAKANGASEDSLKPFQDQLDKLNALSDAYSAMQKVGSAALTAVTTRLHEAFGTNAQKEISTLTTLIQALPHDVQIEVAAKLNAMSTDDVKTFLDALTDQPREADIKLGLAEGTIEKALASISVVTAPATKTVTLSTRLDEALAQQTIDRLVREVPPSQLVRVRPTLDTYSEDVVNRALDLLKQDRTITFRVALDRAQAEREIASIQVPRTIPIEIDVGGGRTLVGGPRAEGGFIWKHQLVEVGEEDKPELILPLTKPARTYELLKQAGIIAGHAADGELYGPPYPPATTLSQRWAMSPTATQQVNQFAASVGAAGAAAGEAAKATSNSADDLRALARAFEVWHAQTGGSIEDFRALLDAQQQLTTLTEQTVEAYGKLRAAQQSYADPKYLDTAVQQYAIEQQQKAADAAFQTAVENEYLARTYGAVTQGQRDYIKSLQAIAEELKRTGQTAQEYIINALRGQAQGAQATLQQLYSQLSGILQPTREELQIQLSMAKESLQLTRIQQRQEGERRALELQQQRELAAAKSRLGVEPTQGQIDNLNAQVEAEIASARARGASDDELRGIALRGQFAVDALNKKRQQIETELSNIARDQAAAMQQLMDKQAKETEALENQIRAQQNQLEVIAKQNQITEIQAKLADQTTLSQRNQKAAIDLTIAAIQKQSATVVDLSTRLFFAELSVQNFTNAINGATTALNAPAPTAEDLQRVRDAYATDPEAAQRFFEAISSSTTSAAQLTSSTGQAAAAMDGIAQATAIMGTVVLGVTQKFTDLSAAAQKQLEDAAAARGAGPLAGNTEAVGLGGVGRLAPVNLEKALGTIGFRGQSDFGDIGLAKQFLKTLGIDVGNFGSGLLTMSEQVKDVTRAMGSDFGFQIREGGLTFEQMRKIAQKFGDDLLMAGNNVVALSTTVSKFTVQQKALYDQFQKQGSTAQQAAQNVVKGGSLAGLHSAGIVSLTGLQTQLSSGKINSQQFFAALTTDERTRLARLLVAQAGHATGGIATQPTYGLFGERGDEALLPLDSFYARLKQSLLQVFETKQIVSPPTIILPPVKADWTTSTMAARTTEIHLHSPTIELPDVTNAEEFIEELNKRVRAEVIAVSGSRSR